MMPSGYMCVRVLINTIFVFICFSIYKMLSHSLSHFILFFNYFFNFYFILLYNTVLVLPYIDMNPTWVYTSSQSWIPLPPPTLYHLSGSSPCTSPKHPVSCIEHRLALRFLHDSIHVSMPFFQIIPPSPSPSESKSPFYTSVSLLLSRILMTLYARQQKRHWCIVSSFYKWLTSFPSTTC